MTPALSRYDFANNSGLVTYTPFQQSTAKHLAIDYQNLKNGLEEKKVTWSVDQLKRIVEISKELLNSDASFLDITTESEPLFKTHKIHVFAEHEKQKVRIYINPRNAEKAEETSHTIENEEANETEDVVEIGGTDKRFTKATRIKLKFDFDSKEVIPKITLAACLRMKLDVNSLNELFARFNNWQKEIKILTHLGKKPNICKLQNWAEYQGNHKHVTDKTTKVSTRKIVMYQDLYESDLFSATHKILNLPPNDRNRIRLQIIKDTSRALSEIHQAGYFHVDLKPENIFLDKDLRAYIGDFGLSVLRSTPQEGIGKGTPSTFAPESLKSAIDKILNRRFDEQTISTASDVWGLGCALLRLYNFNSPHWSDFIETLIVATRALVFSYEVYDDCRKEVLPSIQDIQAHFPELNSELTELKSECDSIINDLREISARSPEEIASYFKEYPEKIKIQEIEGLCIDLRNYLYDLIENPYALEKKLLAKLLHSKLLIIHNTLKIIIDRAWSHLAHNQFSKENLDRFIVQNMLQFAPEKRITTSTILELLKA